MKVLLTNDDGIDAPGIVALEAAFEGEVYVAAPDRQRSECGHQVTTREPIKVNRPSPNRAAVAGTPADCVRLALRGQLFGEIDFDWVLSGINEGGNLGVDIYISGTVAAAREAAILGSPAIAFSHYRRAQLAINWSQATKMVVDAFEAIQKQKEAQIGYWNVNLPHRSDDETRVDHAYCHPCRNPLPVRFQSSEKSDYLYSGVYAQREAESNSDVFHCFSGSIAISHISL